MSAPTAAYTGTPTATHVESEHPCQPPSAPVPLRLRSRTRQVPINLSSTMTRKLFVLFAVFVALVPPTNASAQQSGASATKSCEPVFETTQFHRSIPHILVDQGLAEPPTSILFHRRFSQLGPVKYSLLVFRPDASKTDVTITGMATLSTQAWSFTARCSSDRVTDGIVTTLERIANLSVGPVK
jgi:hypothetical protein